MKSTEISCTLGIPLVHFTVILYVIEQPVDRMPCELNNRNAAHSRFKRRHTSITVHLFIYLFYSVRCPTSYIQAQCTRLHR